jgi:SPP1 family predicted phage head-tail adaptor
MTRIGPMRHRVLIQQGATTGDGYGGVTVTWEDVTTTWAAIKYKSQSGAASRSGQFYDRSQVDFIIRRLNATTLRQGMRIAWDGKYFDVQSVANEDAQGRFWRVVTVEGEVQ